MKLNILPPLGSGDLPGPGKTFAHWEVWAADGDPGLPEQAHYLFNLPYWVLPYQVERLAHLAARLCKEAREAGFQAGRQLGQREERDRIAYGFKAVFGPLNA